MVKALWVAQYGFWKRLNICGDLISSHTTDGIYEVLKEDVPSCAKLGSRLTTDIPSCRGLDKLIGYGIRLRVSRVTVHPLDQLP